MNRCLKFLPALASTAALALLAVAGAGFPPDASAQTGVRTFPAEALRGTLEVTAPPQVVLDGQADRLSPGARIFNTSNLLALSGGLVGQSLTVNYTRDGAGLIHQVWILTADEARERRPGARPARNFLFGWETTTPSSSR